MNIKEYQKKANRTLVSLGSTAIDGAHMAMGFVTELFEMAEAHENDDKVNIIEEHGDTMWYLAGECKIYNLDIEELLVKANELREFARDSFRVDELVDLHKRELAYGKGMDLDKLNEHMVILLADLILVSEREGFTMEESMRKNIAKLKLRFPDKFTNDKAINRDINAERKLLEK